MSIKVVSDYTTKCLDCTFISENHNNEHEAIRIAEDHIESWDSEKEEGRLNHTVEITKKLTVEYAW